MEKAIAICKMKLNVVNFWDHVVIMEFHVTILKIQKKIISIHSKTNNMF